MSPSIISPTRHELEPVNECVYCGKKNGLTDEHIIPLALGGTLVLPKSSCKPCAAITSKFERKVLRDFMYKGRVVGDLPSRRKSKRPSSLPIAFISEDEIVFEREIEITDAPAVIHLPLLAPPSVLSGRPPTAGTRVTGLETIHLGKDPTEVMQINRAMGIRFHDSVDLSAFAQLLAKIAYCNAIATHGLLPRDSSPALELIFGNRQDFSNWLGSGEFNPKTESANPLHVISSTEVRNDLGETAYATRLRLFFNYPTTGYHIATHVPGWQSHFQ